MPCLYSMKMREGFRKRKGNFLIIVVSLYLNHANNPLNTYLLLRLLDLLFLFLLNTNYSYSLSRTRHSTYETGSWSSTRLSQLIHRKKNIIKNTHKSSQIVFSDKSKRFIKNTSIFQRFLHPSWFLDLSCIEFFLHIVVLLQESKNKKHFKVS